MRVLFAGGGTGGHLYPALAVAHYMRQHVAGFECLFLGSAHGLESRIVPQAGFSLHQIPGSGFRRHGLWGRLRALVGLFRGLLSIPAPTVGGLVWEHIGPPYVFLAAIAIDVCLRLPLLALTRETLHLLIE